MTERSLPFVYLRRAAGLALAASLALASGPSLATADSYRTIDGASPVPLQEQAGLRSPEELEAFIDGIMTAQMRAQKAIGGMVSVIKDGQVFFAKGYGYADADKTVPVDAARTLFRPGSVAKLFTWTALMQLVEQGHVELDADVNQYISQFQIADTFPGQPITVRNLFTHSAGLEDGSVGFLILDSEERLLSPVEALKRYMPQRVRPPAGGDFTNGNMASYSNWATELAGLIISNVSGQSFNDYIEANIFQPLGMAHSSFRQPLPEKLSSALSDGFNLKGGKLQPQPFEWVMYPAAGSLSATATDIATFMIAHAQKGALGEQRILSQAAAEQMHARALSPNPHVNGAALGFYENYVNGRRLLVHAGNTTQFQTEFNLLIDEGVGLFFSVNSESTLQFSARKELLHAFMDRYYPAHLPRVEAPQDFAERAAEYTGSYRFNRHSYSTVEKAFSLLSTGLSISATAENTLRLSGIGPLPTEWVEVAKDTFRMVDDDAMLAFGRDANGQVAYLLNAGALPSMQAYKVPLRENPQLHWLLQGLAALGFVIAIVSVFRNWSADKAGPGLARAARWTAALAGLCQLGFLLLFVVVISALMANPLGPYPELLNTALYLPLIAAALTLLMAVFSLAAWVGAWWSGYGRVQYSLITVLAVAMLWSLNTWNLLGHHLP